MPVNTLRMLAGSRRRPPAAGVARYRFHGMFSRRLPETPTVRGEAKKAIVFPSWVNWAARARP